MVRLIIVPWSTEPPQNIVIRVQHKSSSMKREPLFLSLPDFPHNTLNSQSHHHKTPRANRRLSSPQDSYHKALTTTRLLLPQKILLRSLKTLDFQYSKFSKPQIFAFTRKMAMPFRTPAATGVASSSNAPYTSKSSFLTSGLSPLATCALNNTEASCSICLEHYTHEDPASQVTQCGHIFHTPCMTEWVESGSSTCPMCRAQLFTPPIKTKVNSNHPRRNMFGRRSSERSIPGLPRMHEGFDTYSQWRMGSLGLGTGMGSNFQPSTPEAPLDY